MKRLSLLVWATASTLPAFSVQPLLHMDLRGGYAGVAGQASTALIQGELMAVPAIQLDEKASLTPSFYLLGGGQERALDQGALFVQTASVGFRPQFRYRTDQGSSYLARFEARRAYNVEAVNESPGTGRYDYEDLRLAGGWDSAPGEWPFGASLELGHRGYPNYHNIAAAVALTDDKNYYLKDYYGTKGEAHLGLAPLGRLSFALERKGYSDAYVIDAVTGQVDTSKAQSDLVYDVALRGGLPLSEAWALGWDLDWQANSSNQNSFDTSQAQPQSLPNSNDYMATAAGLSAQWKADNGFAMMGGYTLNFRNLNRPIQDPAGAYTQGKVAEVEHDVDLGLSYPMAYGLRGVAGASARLLLSNQGYAATGIPSYTYYSTNVGLQWDWQGGR